jgi:protein-L-isoaspartate(D-aspartate) O-methyltransferase
MKPDRCLPPAAWRLCLALGAAAMLLALASGCSTAAEEPAPARPEPAAAALQGSAPKEAPPTAARGPDGKPWSPPVFTARQQERDEMVRVIKAYGLEDGPVLAAMAAVPRHEFVPPALARSAYANTPLPIGHEQTISQPYIVAEMTRQLRLKAGAKVLEIGTGSGYQAAVLTHFTTEVYSIEIIKPLAEEAQNRLKRLGYDVVKVRCGDGAKGWPEAAPFDAIIGTCTAGEVPPPLVEQLKASGRMVIPIGQENRTQYLMLIEKDAAGRVHRRPLMPVRFVPLLSEDPTAK